MDCNSHNFPVKCFYNDDKDEIYSFYRQGHSFKMKPDNITDYQYKHIYDGDFGQIVLVNNECLIIQSSSKLIFMRQEYDKLTKLHEWAIFN